MVNEIKINRISLNYVNSVPPYDVVQISSDAGDGHFLVSPAEDVWININGVTFSMQSCDEAAKKIKDLEEKLKKATTALQYYSISDTYKRNEYDGGILAEKTLKELEEIKETDQYKHKEEEKKVIILESAKDTPFYCRELNLSSMEQIEKAKEDVLHPNIYYTMSHIYLQAFKLYADVNGDLETWKFYIQYKNGNVEDVTNNTEKAFAMMAKAMDKLFDVAYKESNYEIF